ncbi:hypothetical protein C0993_005074, partial [Termitomyces sp. T159_Od127]
LCFDPRDSLSPLPAFLLIPGTRSPPVLARLILSHPRDSRQPPALVFPPPRHLSHPPAPPALLYAPSPAPLRSPTPRATPGALCSCTVN